MLSLASLGLARLQDEPLRLEDEARAVDEALHDLSLDQYRVFIVNQDCVRHMKLKGADMAQHIRALEEGLEGLAGGFTTFQKEAAELLAGHRRNKQTLAHHMQLVELLEIPQLMDTCVRNSGADSAFAEDALALAGFTQGLLARHMRTTDGSSEPQVPAVIALIAEEVAKSLRSLRSRMLASLRGNASLASCLQVVSCLRRLELLQLSSSATATPHQRRRRRSSVADADGRARGRGHLSPYSYLVDVIETCRTHWFEIATQFRAIFGADGDAALASWLARRVGAFAALLRAALPLVEDAASVRSLLEQCMSFAASMGRLGADFRGLLVPAFEAAVWNGVTAQWRSATRAFQEGLARLAKASAHSSAAARSNAGAAPPLPLCVQKAPLGTPRAGSGAANGERWGGRDTAAAAAAECDGDALLPPPPLSLLNYPLLAHFFNDVVAGLNHLRECAPLSLEAGLREHLALCVDAVCEALAAHRRALRSAGGSGGSSGAGGGSSGSSDDAVGVAAHAMAAHVVPHLAACFCHIFAGGGGAAHDAA
ncbi:Dor1-like family-domain-containing protein, partial [Tribonema minus]